MKLVLLYTTGCGYCTQQRKTWDALVDDIIKQHPEITAKEKINLDTTPIRKYMKPDTGVPQSVLVNDQDVVVDWYVGLAKDNELHDWVNSKLKASATAMYAGHIERRVKRKGSNPRAHSKMNKSTTATKPKRKSTTKPKRKSTTKPKRKTATKPKRKTAKTSKRKSRTTKSQTRKRKSFKMSLRSRS